MRQWEIYKGPIVEGKAHPIVIISNNERCESDRYKSINALLCSSIADVGVRPTDVYLDEADGLDHGTGVQCEYLYIFKKIDLLGHVKMGEVTAERRKAIGRKLRECLRLG